MQLPHSRSDTPEEQAPHLISLSFANKTRSRRRAVLVVAPLLVLLVLWMWLFYAEGAYSGGPSGKAFGADFAMFVAAAQVLHEGGNPFDHTRLYRTERLMLQRQGLPILKQAPTVRVGNPPLFFWALQPLTKLPFQSTALAWILAMYALAAGGLIGCLRFLGWKRRFLPCLVFLLMPQVVLGVFYGNVICLVFAGLSWALALLKTRPFLAGMLLSVAVLKPPVALPTVLLVVLFSPRVRGRVVAGFGTAVAALFAVTLAVMGWKILVLWVGGLLGYSRDIALEPDVASLAGLYVRWAPTPLHLGLESVILGIAFALTGLWWWKYRNLREMAVLAASWLWFVWFLATPYAHFFDEIVLTVPVLALLGPDGQNLSGRLPVWGLYLMFFSLFLLSWSPFQTQLLSLTLLAVMICLLFVARGQPRPIGTARLGADVG